MPGSFGTGCDRAWWFFIGLALSWLSVAQLQAQSTYTPYQFSTLAGTDGGLGVEDGTGTAARFYMPRAVAADGNGNVYVADWVNHTIRKITSAGVVTALAGAVGSYGGEDGTGVAARFRTPFGVAADSSGNVYVADTNNRTIRKITPAGVVTTLAGLAGDSGSADGLGAAARFNLPYGVAADRSGNVYVADTHNHTIRKITAAGVVTTLAGMAGNFGNVDGPGASARFFLPYAVAADADGNVYVVERDNHTIRKITATGEVATLAGKAGSAGIADGLGATARFSLPRGLTVDEKGNIYVADSNSSTIRKITSAGVVTTLTGTAGSSGNVDGVGAAARFNFPHGVAADGHGDIYVADTTNNTIRKVNANGEVTTLAGKAARRDFADGSGANAAFMSPAGVAADNKGTVYVADSGNSTIRKIMEGGAVTTLAGPALFPGNATAHFWGPSAVTVDYKGDVYVADTSNHVIRKITAVGAVTTLAGVAGSSGSVDGTGQAARFWSPQGLAVDGSGNVYVADSNNSIIRKITAAGDVTTIAGTAGFPGSLDGIGVSTQFWGPRGVAVDTKGDLYVADTNNHTIRKITAAGEVTTVAGLAGSPGSVDGTGQAARFNGPKSLAVDGSGNVYVADTNNSTIRRITPASVVTTLGGVASKTGAVDGTTGSADGVGAAARFNLPSGVAVDASGVIYVADTENHRIRKGSAFQAPPTVITQPVNQIVAAGQSATITVAVSGADPTSYEWQKDGKAVAGATGSSLTLANVQPEHTGLYSVAITNGATAFSVPALVGVATLAKVLGAGAEIGANVLHANGNVFDQVLLQGAAATITADHALGQVTRLSYIDLSDDIVQIEFSGPGTLSILLDNLSGPAEPLKYNQPGVVYMKGHAGIVITGATEDTNVTVFTVGRATAFDPTGKYNILLPISSANSPVNNGSPLFRGQDTTSYDGVADLAFITIASANGNFGGVRTAGASYFAAQGYTGVYAPGVKFHGPLYVGDITALESAAPVLQVGSVSDARITGGDLFQTNGQAVTVSGIKQLKFTAGTTSQGSTWSAQTCQARLLQDGVDMTWQIAANASP